jgi:hypothetical protein
MSGIKKETPEVILFFYSPSSPSSMSVFEKVVNLSFIKKVNIDNKTVRLLVKDKIEYVPCLLCVYEDKTEQFIGSDCANWVKEVLNNIQKQQPSPVQPKKNNIIELDDNADKRKGDRSEKREGGNGGNKDGGNGDGGEEDVEDDDDLPNNVSKLNMPSINRKENDDLYEYNEDESDRNKNKKKSSMSDILDMKEQEEKKYMTQKKRKENVKIDMSDREEFDIKREVVSQKMFAGQDMTTLKKGNSGNNILTLAQKMQKERDEEKEVDDNNPRRR